MMKITKLAAMGMLFSILTISVGAAEIDDGLKAFQSGRYSDALKILVPLANAGNDEAQRIVGEMCYNGQGMKRDVAASFKWNEIAAAGGNKIAQYNIGYLYEKGEGVASSRPQAIEWYTKAALQGYVAAQHKLGDLYDGSDDGKSIYWYKKAGESGDEVARKQFSALSTSQVRETAEATRIYEAKNKIKEQQEADDNRRERNRRAALEAEDRQSTSDYNAAIGAQIRQRGAADAALLGKIDLQTNAAIADYNRVLAAQAAERDRARAEREDREADRRREAESERAARANAERSTARARTSEPAPELPKYQPQVVMLPKADLVCPPGSSWHNAAGPGAKGGTCYADSAARTSNAERPLSTNGKATRQKTASSSDSNVRSDSPNPTKSEGKSTKQPPKVEWGPIELEDIAICRQSTKSKKWGCNGSLDNQTIFDEPTLESALSRQHCSGGTWAAGGPILEGVQWDAYRCGHSLGAGDYDIVKRYALITARRSYICPKYQSGDGRCSTIYDGQDKR